MGSICQRFQHVSNPKIKTRQWPNLRQYTLLPTERKNRHAIRISWAACLFVLIPFSPTGEKRFSDGLKRRAYSSQMSSAIFLPRVNEAWISTEAFCSSTEYNTISFLRTYSLIPGRPTPQHHMIDTYMVRMINPSGSVSAAACTT